METLKFGRFEIRPAVRQVWAGGAPVPLGARAFDLLILLAEQRDRVVSKNEIFDKVWPGLVVEENNLSVQISALRRALGADSIATVTGRGYRFAAQPADEPTLGPPAAVAGNLPARRMSLFGRDQELAQLNDALAEPACVTLCGLAGVGKTALASLAAQQLSAGRRYAQGAWRIDLTDVRDPALLARAVCESLGIELGGRQDALRECLANLQYRELLLVLDNCEHIVDAVANFVGELLACAEKVSVLATSQEPLRVPGERVMRLSPLAVPESADTDGAETYGAVCMLLERVRGAMGGSFEPSPEELVDLIEICRQLDGIPLALEFAATRVPLLGMAGVRSRLHDRLRLLAGGARSAPTRHRSLQAALEWSHQLLSTRTQEVLHRLAVFPSGFSLVGAQLLLNAGSEADIIEHLNVLVDRSMVTFQAGSQPRYRLLETTRAFALDCLQAASDGTDWQERHAITMAKLCVRAARERDSTWMWQEMPNTRAALSWALTGDGHGETALTIATYTSVVLGAGGAIREALDNLQRVQHLLNDKCPAPLVARYWHWLGRLGVEGRLPSSLCVEALTRADTMFEVLGEARHRHACQRHLAEAELRAGHVEKAEQHLLAARELEEKVGTPADRVRRQRVEAMLADARQQHALALRHAQAALTLAEAHGIDSYRLLLMADMAWTHLQMGHADAAVTAFQELVLHLDERIRQGLTWARALCGLTAALVAADRINDAVRGARRTARALQQANLLHSRCDVFAWVAAAVGDAQTAAQLIGAGEDFAARTETERDPISELARHKAMTLIAASLQDEDRLYWVGQGSNVSEAELMHLLEHAFAETSIKAADKECTN
jgi:predicted ATPase